MDPVQRPPYRPFCDTPADQPDAAQRRHAGLEGRVRVGVSTTGIVVDLLPPEGACSLELPPAAGAAGPATPEQRLAHLLSGVIDLAGDDARLRAVRVADTFVIQRPPKQIQINYHQNFLLKPSFIKINLMLYFSNFKLIY